MSNACLKTSQSSTTLHVIVVGAGASGLSLAIELGRLHRGNAPEKKLKITIIEASSTVGGRVRTIRTANNDAIANSKFLSLTPSHQQEWKKRYEQFAPWPIPLGAEFVHGEECNPTILDRHGGRLTFKRDNDQPTEESEEGTRGAMSYVQDWEMDLVIDYSRKIPNLTVFADGQCFHWYDGNLTNPDQVLTGRQWSIFIRRAKKLWTQIHSTHEHDQRMTLEEFVACEYEGSSRAVNEQLCVLAILNAVYAVTAGTNSRLLGVKETSRQENLWPYGEKTFRLGGCYSELIDELLVELESFNDCPDVTVDIVTSTPVEEVSVKSNHLQVTASQDRSQYTCDCIGITVPLASLKRGILHFTGNCALPAQKQRAIQDIHALTGGKVHALMKWGVDLYNVQQIAYDRLRGIFICPLEDIKQIWFRWDDSSILATGFFVLDEDADKQWTDNFHIGESLKLLLISILSQIMSPDIFPTHSNGSPFLNFSAFDVYNWGNDNYVQGIYSSPSVRLGREEKSQYQALADPISNCIFFAGEHTHTEASATVQSALESGVRAAREIHQQLLLGEQQ
ncbi:hypothetical protein ACHAW6_011700 [Cyclotella cf. meneghiniana]